MPAPPALETIAISAEPPIARLTLSRPEKLNALSRRALEDVIAAAAWLDASPEIRAAVLAGAGRAFCAGADLGDLGAVFDPDADIPGGRRALAALGGRAADALEGVRAVTVAALHGHVVGGGLVLAAACDLRIAADDTVFRIPEVEIGIPLAWGGVPRLVREIGPAATKELVITCRSFGAAEALALRFLNRVVPAAELEVAAGGLAADVARMPAGPAAMTKAQVNAVTRAGLDTSFADADHLLAAYGDPESRDAAAAYRARTLGI
ncbi:MAG: enoyl-CoA hydratase/isomerase family protein [Solirubrobacteraceae bacterium]